MGLRRRPGAAGKYTFPTPLTTNAYSCVVQTWQMALQPARRLHSSTNLPSPRAFPTLTYTLVLRLLNRLLLQFSYSFYLYLSCLPSNHTRFTQAAYRTSAAHTYTAGLSIIINRSEALLALLRSSFSAVKMYPRFGKAPAAPLSKWHLSFPHRFDVI
jgi:hypothetical protein